LVFAGRSSASTACASKLQFAGDEKYNHPDSHVHVSSAAHSVQRGTVVSRKRQHCTSDSNRILEQFAAFTDYRNPDLIEHPVKEWVAQRVYGLALGYED
jgi:hypothetical protein